MEKQKTIFPSRNEQKMRLIYAIYVNMIVGRDKST